MLDSKPCQSRQQIRRYSNPGPRRRGGNTQQDKGAGRRAGSRRAGLSLVEVIVALAILAIVVVLMTPVLVSAFRQITANGDRARVGKEIVGSVESELAKESYPASGATVPIAIGGGVTVDAYRITMNDDSQLGEVDLNTYLVPSMPFVAPPGTPAELKAVNLNISGWSPSSPYVALVGVTSAQSYRIVTASSPDPAWLACSPSGGSISIQLADPNIMRRIEVKASSSSAVVDFLLKAAPVMIKYASTSKTVTFRISDDGGLSYRTVQSSDQLQYKEGNGSWITPSISSGLTISKPSGGKTLYFRFSNGQDVIGSGDLDTPSLYVAVPY